MSRYYRRRKKRLSNNIDVLILIIILMLSTKYVKIEKYFIVLFGIVALFVLIVVVKYLLKYIKRQKSKWRYLKSDIRKIDSMEGEQFEKYLKVHFEKKGFKVKTTPVTNDYGADLILLKRGIKTVVQAKRYRDKVSNKAVQEVVAAMGYYKANKGMVITNAYFTANAKALANANNIDLWDRNKLIEVFQVKS